jgi:hypothetical protein
MNPLLMRRIFLSSVFLATLGVSSGAYAACPVVTTTGPIQWYAGASSNNQCNDGDDLAAFVDKKVETVPDGTPIDMSLGKNDQSFQNIVTVGNGGSFETDGSGFANFKSTQAGSTSNSLTKFTFTPGPSLTLPDGTPFNGFDGELFRGQIDNTGTGGNTFNGDLLVTVTLSGGGGTFSHLYTGLSDKMDFGVLGFDEIAGMTYTIASVTMDLNSGPGGSEFGAWNEFKQIDFSVPGAIAVIPETSTWAMMALGFAGLGFVAFRRGRKQTVATFG